MVFIERDVSMKNHEDLRIIKTKRILQETLISLLKDNAFEAIKVSDLCKKALVNRSTFYAHYNDKFELFMDTIATLKEDLEKDLSKNENLDTTDYLMKMMDIYLTHIEERKKIYLPIMQHNRNGIIIDIVYDILEKDILDKIKNDKTVKPSIAINIVVKFYIGAIFNVSTEYLLNSNKYNKEELCYYLEKLVKGGLSSL